MPSYTPADVLILIPTRGREGLLKRALQSLADTPGDWRAHVIHDGEPIPLWGDGHDRVYHGMASPTHERVGYFEALNIGLTYGPTRDREIIAYFANDVAFDADWLDAALACWNSQMDSAGGLLCVQDGYHNDYHASHGITSRTYLAALYGRASFGPYFMGYGDSELVQWTRDLERLGYCENSRVLHLHPDVDLRIRDAIDEEAVGSKAADHALYDDRFDWWENKGGRKLVRARLAEAQERWVPTTRPKEATDG